MTSSKSAPPSNVVVVDGSNIATEGRSMPSLTQLVEAVTAFTEEYPDAIVTVVVDATFGHRIDKSELAEFDAAVAHNELVAPPAGAIGRGDAFVLSIANKVGARILSNDSFQEFHGEYSWLFDEGRLIGGKPVPFVGWVFVERLPVKGPISRKATRGGRPGGGRDARPSRRQASKAASLPMPVPTAPPPRPLDQRAVSAVVDSVIESAAEPPPRPAPAAGGPVNDLLPFLDFVEHHPVGSSVNGVVDTYSSHGAYVTIGDLRGYVPLRLMGDPPPRSAREVMKLGDAVTLVVTSFAPARRSVDLAIPKVAPVSVIVPSPPLDEVVAAAAKPARKRSARKQQAAAAPGRQLDAVQAAVAEAALEAIGDTVPQPATKPARRRAAKPAAEVVAAPAAAPALAASEPAVTKAAARKARTVKAVPAVEQAPAPPPAAKQAIAKQAPAKTTTAKQAPAKQATAKQAAAAQAPATQAPAKKAAAKKAAAKTATAKTAPAKRAAALEAAGAPVKRAARRKAAPVETGA